MMGTMRIAPAVLLCALAAGRARAQSGDELLALEASFRATLNAHDADGFASGFAEDGTFDYVALGTAFTGLDQIRSWIQSVFAGFPDYDDSHSLRRVATNKLVTECVPTSTHLGTWLGIPATGRSTSVPHMSIYDWESGRIRRLAFYDDGLTLMMQLGVVPAGTLPPLVPSVAPGDPTPTGLSPLDAQAEAMLRFNSHDWAHWTAMFRADADIYYNVLGVPIDRNVLVALNEMYAVGFPDIQVEVLRMDDLGDGWVVCEAVSRGTHNGPYLGVPATGRPMANRLAWLARFDAEGMLTYFHVYFDNLGVLVQLGAIQLPGASAVEATTWGQVKDAAGR